MPAKAKKILITTETREVVWIRHSPEFPISGFCNSCGQQTRLLNFDSAISYAAYGGRELLSQIQTGKVHLVETVSGGLLFCRRSLAVP